VTGGNIRKAGRLAAIRHGLGGNAAQAAAGSAISARPARASWTRSGQQFLSGPSSGDWGVQSWV